MWIFSALCVDVILIHPRPSGERLGQLEVANSVAWRRVNGCFILILATTLFFAALVRVRKRVLSAGAQWPKPSAE